MTIENANVFGLSWIGDGTKIKRTSLLNMLAMCRSKPPAVIAILDCTGHMVDGGKMMLNSSCPFLYQSLMSLIQERHLLTPSFLMGRKCSKSMANPVCTLPAGNVFLLRGTCLVTVLE